MKVDYNINGLCSEDEQKLMPFSVFLSLSGQYFCSAVKKSISFFHKIFIPKFATDCKSLSVHNKMHVEPYISLFDQTIKCKFSWAICIISLTDIFKSPLQVKSKRESCEMHLEHSLWAHTIVYALF